ncbi:protein kinase, putative [Trichomonas vaginalis G3]|uniref:Protein kinase, putative n=1 Tax=Trichomonas vaginalis (strain ATCC PRA-98 / G3) TaxID=412133 RepID=A2DJ36_TRIV3|nr:protein serine/threonine kinase protein [Trichomonas vaginalis G3]EAY19611.1 protein kinase, putative [Trichomonas vaginalis G3]KAI5515051.1 protein serine/threonine kinase protein [Trichomonas vaginalis G3]|eukprot:XP_001580597.1 protein kinase [Trichomonas vaginalis G3]
MVIQEYCSGGEMFTKVRTGPNIRESEIIRYSLQIISAINYLHTRNIMHRDIKLENIVLDNNGDAKIIDFGLSEVVNDVNLKTHCGTLIYMAPEMLSQRQFDGKAVDIWAIGICIYAMVTRTFPWKSTTDEELLHEIIQADIFFPNFVCPTISELLHGTLVKNPSERAPAAELISIISRSALPRGISKYASKTHYNDEILLAKRKRCLQQRYLLSLTNQLIFLSLDIQNRCR